MPKPFAVVMMEYHTVRLFGIRIQTNLHNAPVECPKLWKEVFTPRMPELSGKPTDEYQGPSYGISVFTDHVGLVFDYWAAMEAPAQGTPPAGMDTVTLPGGMYACCRIPAAGMLQDAYDYMYDEWPNTGVGYTVLPDKPCFELYNSRFFQSGTHDIYVPVLPSKK